jgi:glycosyltransferase involved in cell wall biosynthesis
VNYSRRIRVQNEINAAKSYNKILVNSLFSRENLIRSYGIDSNVCYLGIETEKFNSEETVKEPFVVGLGSITFLKSVHKAIEIIGKIPKTERPELKWVANFMDKYYLDELINLANKLEVEFKVFVNISDDELTTILSRAAIMIYTSRLEPFGLAPLEANACGTYVAAIAEGGVRESIINGLNGTLINGYKINEIADVVKLFVKDLNLARIKGDAARKFVREKWNKQFMANNILSEFEDILNFSKSN